MTNPYVQLRRSVRDGRHPLRIRASVDNLSRFAAPLQLGGEAHGVWDGRIDRVFLFVLRLERLPTLQLDNREIISAQLVRIDDLHKVPLTGPVQAPRAGEWV
jgi:hypothetical protein